MLIQIMILDIMNIFVFFVSVKSSGETGGYADLMFEIKIRFNLIRDNFLMDGDVVVGATVEELIGD